MKRPDGSGNLQPAKRPRVEPPAPLKEAALTDKGILSKAALGNEAKVLDTSALDRPGTEVAVLEIVAVPADATLDQGILLSSLPGYDQGVLHVMIGQFMRLGVRVAGRPEAPAGITWKIDGHTVGRCVQSDMAGTAPAISADACLLPVIEFSWVSSGRTAVTVTADGMGAGVTAAVQVLAPVVELFEVTTEAVQVIPDGLYLDKTLGTWLGPYDYEEGMHGCTWEATVKRPGTKVGRRISQGQVGFIQVLGSSLKLVEDGKEPQDESDGGGPRGELTALDAGEGEVLYCPWKPFDGSEAEFDLSDGCFDSPAMQLPPEGIEAHYEVSFRLHLVYRWCHDDGLPGGAWVTLAHADWSFMAEASRESTDDEWSLSADSWVAPPPGRPEKGVTRQGVPTWSGRAGAGRSD